MTPVTTMRRGAVIFSLIAGLALVAGCASGAGLGERGSPLSIVAATELADMETVIEQASEELGFDIELVYTDGTLANSRMLADGEFDGQHDATWFATNRYVELFGAYDKLAESTEIARSPVAFGITTAKAGELGWDSEQPAWTEIADAAAAGEFVFGMTDPATSNSGFSALVSVATAMADTGVALTGQDIAAVSPRLQDFFTGQTLTSGSSGWLAETFLEETGRADAIINYESVLHTMRDDGADLQVIVPADGVVSADYPLSTLAFPSRSAAHDQVEELSRWLIDHPELLTDTYRRPVDGSAQLPEAMADQLLIELPFPGSAAVTDALVHAYNNELRAPGSTVFVLDTSGSMEGYRLQSLQETMTSLIDGTATVDGMPVGLRGREHVNILPFASEPGEPVTRTYDLAEPGGREALAGAIDDLSAEGLTAVYDSVLEAHSLVDTAPGVIPSIVVMTDGDATAGATFDHFEEVYDTLPEEVRGIPVFVILYGEANAEEMTALAELTGGKVFDALTGDLDAAFKEIRAYQ